jgi:hypothetical protein
MTAGAVAITLVPPPAVGTLALGLGLVGLIVAAVALNLARTRSNRNSTFLEWDPVDRDRWHAELDAADVHLMLAEHNRRRAERGLAAETMAEYAERARGDQG